MTTAASNRRWFRYSLGTLFVLLTLACVAFAWIASTMRAATRQREAVQVFRQANAYVSYDCALDDSPFEPPKRRVPRWLRDWLGDDFFRNVSEVSGFFHVTDTEMNWIAAFPRLKKLELKLGCVSLSGLKHLRGCTRLEYLEVDDTLLTEEGVKFLSDFSHLKNLRFIRTETSDGIGRFPYAWRTSEPTEAAKARIRKRDNAIKGLRLALPKCVIPLKPRPL